MNITKLKKILSDTKKYPYVEWNNKEILSLIKENRIYSPYLFNKDNNHGYFSLLHNLVSNIDGIIVEVGNREGLGILSIYDALNPNSTFYSLDIVDDNRFVPDLIKNDKRVKIMNNFNSLDLRKISTEFSKKTISLIFFDTIHTYEQISQEYKCWEPFMMDNCIMLIDDIRDVQDDRTKWKFHEEIDWQYKYDVTEWAHNNTGFGVYLR